MKKSFPRIKIQNIPIVTSTELPPVLLYPLLQGGKKELVPKVKVKQRVVSGELLAEGSVAGGQKIHTAIGGVVKNIRPFRYSGNYKTARALEIELGGELNTFSREREIDMSSLNPDKVFSDIEEAGVFDLDAGVIGVKIKRMLEGGIETIVLNAIEVFPYMSLEEKILELHAKEITTALVLLQQAITQKQNREVELSVLSNYTRNRSTTLKHLHAILGKSNKIKGRKLSLGISPENIPKQNSTWIIDTLFDENKFENRADLEMYISKVLVLKPSTLLAIYEAVFYGKPHIEKYVQLIVSEKRTLVFKTFLGIPLFYLLTQIKDVTEDANHFFVGDFIKRTVVFDFITPVSKHFSHIFAITDEAFSHIYTQLKHWYQGDHKRGNNV